MPGHVPIPMVSNTKSEVTLLERWLWGMLKLENNNGKDGGGGAAKSGANLSDPQRARQHQNHGGTF